MQGFRIDSENIVQHRGRCGFPRRIAQSDFPPRLHDLLRALAQSTPSGGKLTLCLSTQKPLKEIFPPKSSSTVTALFDEKTGSSAFGGMVPRLGATRPEQEIVIRSKMPTLPLQPYLVAISVANVDRAVAWYQNHLGFSISKRMDFPDYALRIILMEQNGFLLELLEKQHSFALKERLPELEDNVFVWGLKKLAFLVPNADELAATLKTAGVKFLFDVSEQLDWPGGGAKSFIVEDPDGNWVQFFQKLD